MLAPMADVTDVPFRTIISRCGRPDVFYTEFVSAHGLASTGRERLLHDLALTETDHPIVAQFFGTVPEHLYAAAKLAKELGFDGVDVNMGCPDRSIVKHGAGIALAKDPALAKEIIAALLAGGLPVAVKTRLGLYKTDEMEEWILALLEAKPDVLIIHGRTMKEMSKVPAHWDLIGRVAEMAKKYCSFSTSSGRLSKRTLIIGNGDVVSRRQGIELAQRWGVDGVMVGRGIFSNPWLFNPAVDIASVSPRRRLQLLLEHTELWLKQWQGIKLFDLMRKFYKVYVSGWDGAKELRAQLMRAGNADQVREIVDSYINQKGIA